MSAVASSYYDCDDIVEFNQIRHGQLNSRIYVTYSTIKTPNTFHDALVQVALAQGYGKIIAKVKGSQLLSFLKKGYKIEATVPGYFGSEDAVFISYFLDKNREQSEFCQQYDEIVAKALKANPWHPGKFNEPVQFRSCNLTDIRALSKLYGHVYTNYSSPVSNEEFIKTSMNNGVQYYCADYMGVIVGCLRVELDIDTSNARIYDLGVMTQFQNQGIASALLNKVKQFLQQQDIKNVYTLCLATSLPVNKIFSQQKYEFGGRLTNNNRIEDEFKSLNLWFKKLAG
ncbi:putative beta-lysine N-acetyltransferase [Pseudoalteromonas sp. MTN2-4]|uniref:putative beta-lysine N-acetyltransferase n=1 Tax=Pseudoalteromonas sp. MTN2-4 TaxID=3056555 RepID=UPI0036F2E4A5